MAEQHIQVATNLRGPVRRETYMGREHYVVPAVLVRSKVLQNNLGRTFLPAEDITPEWAEQANGTPAVADHPGTSARQPDVMNKLGVGFLYRARAQNGALKADVFLDPARAGDVADLQVVLDKLDRGEKVEVSTGFPVVIDETPGVHNGAEYDLVIHPAGFDHLAVFAEAIGACSVEDGCGLAANKAEGCGCENVDPEPVDLPAPPELPEAAIRNSAWRGFFAKALALFGWAPAENESDEDRRNMLRSALIERFGADDRWLFVDSVFSEDGLVVFEIESRSGGESGLFRTEFEIDENGAVTLGEAEEVRRVTTFEPVANAEGTHGDNTQEEGTMNRETLIAQLAEKGPLDKDALSKLSDCELKALHQAKDGGAANADTQLPPESIDDSEAMKIAHKYRRENEELRARYEPAHNAQEKERAKLLDDLLYSAANLPYTPDEIRAMDVVAMRKVHALAFPKRADYSARGAPAAANVGAGAFDFVQGIMDGPRGSSALDRKEAN